MTTEEIYDQIITEKNTVTSLDWLPTAQENAQTLLSDLDTESSVSVFRLWVWITAFAHYLQLNRWDTYLLKLTAYAKTVPVGTADWYIRKAYEFQLGDELVVTNYQAGYALIDPLKQIIKRAAITLTSNEAVLKVAKEVSGVVTPLSPVELDSFISYISSIKFAGSRINVLSAQKDLLKIRVQVYKKATADSTTVHDAVKQSINTYLTALDFVTGALIVNKLIDAMQSVQGVDDVFIELIEAKPNAGTYTAVVRKYDTSSGYIEVDSAWDLDANIIVL